MRRRFCNISLRLRLSILTMLFVVGLSGIMLLLINRNISMQITAVAVPLTKIYIPEETTDSDISDTSKISETIESSVPIPAVPIFPATEVVGENTVPSTALKLQKASYVLSTTAQDIRRYSYIAFGGIVLFSGIFVYYFCGRMLKPVRQLAEEMGKRNVNTLNQPIENENAVAEMKQLSDAFNHMIENLNHSFEIQKQFNANAAHELRTPIAILQTNMEMLEEEGNPPTEEYQAFMGIAKRTVSRMSQLVESLLQMTQMEQAVKTDIIDLCSLTKKALAYAQSISTEKNVSIAYNSILTECYIKGNETLFFTAVYNLIENAVKYNRLKGSIQLDLSKEEDSALITVSDTGIGIEPLELLAIFQPFYRVDKSRARGLGGAGMGLSLVKNIAEFHGGTVLAKSELTVGSSFQIRIPLWIAKD